MWLFGRKKEGKEEGKEGSKKGSEPKKRLLCPARKSDHVNYLPWLGQIYDCPKCGWRGPLVITAEEKPNKNAKPK